MIITIIEMTEDPSEDFEEIAKKMFLRSGYYGVLREIRPGQTRADHSTHGLPYSFNHPDFEISFPTTAKAGLHALSSLVDRVKAGEVFEDGEMVMLKPGPDMDEVQIQLRWAKATDERRVLRLVLPTDDGDYANVNGCDCATCGAMYTGILPEGDLSLPLLTKEERNKFKRWLEEMDLAKSEALGHAEDDSA